MKKSFDEIERELLALLLADSRQPTVALAKQLGLARTTVHQRIERLEQSGVIIGYSAILSRDPAAEHVRAVALLSIAQKSQKQVVERLAAMPEVKQCLAITGAHDLLLSLDAPQVEDLDALFDEIIALPGVERCESHIVMSTKFDRRAALIEANAAPQAFLPARQAG